MLLVCQQDSDKPCRLGVEFAKRHTAVHLLLVLEPPDEVLVFLLQAQADEHPNDTSLVPLCCLPLVELLSSVKQRSITVPSNALLRLFMLRQPSLVLHENTYIVTIMPSRSSVHRHVPYSHPVFYRHSIPHISVTREDKSGFRREYVQHSYLYKVLSGAEGPQSCNSVIAPRGREIGSTT